MDRITIDVTRTKGSSSVVLRVHVSTPGDARFAYSTPARHLRLPEGAALDASSANELLAAVTETLLDLAPQLPF